MASNFILVLVFAGLFVIIFFWFIAMYNRLVRLRVDCDNGWSQIDVQLKRRYDLIPNLVETVKGYATHEKGTFEAVVAARTRAVAAKGVAETAEAESALTASLGRLIAVAEAYPQLKADANFRGLQEELSSTENKIGFARQNYNDCVARYETGRESFPTNIVAGAFHFPAKEYFQLEGAQERQAPKVSFS